jgi:hypothetical protein
MPKHVCQVKDVEFTRFSTLTSNSIEPLSFTVPRVKVNSPSNLSENVKSFFLFLLFAERLFPG